MLAKLWRSYLCLFVLNRPDNFEATRRHIDCTLSVYYSSVQLPFIHISFDWKSKERLFGASKAEKQLSSALEARGFWRFDVTGPGQPTLGAGTTLEKVAQAQRSFSTTAARY